MTEHPFLYVCLLAACGLAFGRYLSPLALLALRRAGKALPQEIGQDLSKQSKTAVSLLIFWAVCHSGLHFIPLEEKWRAFLSAPLTAIFAYSLLLIFWRFLDVMEKILILRMEESQKSSSDDDEQASAVETGSLTKHLLPYSKKILKVLTAFLLVLLFLQNAGLNVTSLLAGLGLGGVAVALAAKESLSNFFGGFAVIMDKPFSTGDWIVCNDMEGTVEDIGFRSTKIKTFYDSVLTVPNALISASIVDNLGKRKARRTRVTLDLSFGTPPGKIPDFIEGIKNILRKNAHTRKDYYQCYFAGYGPYSLQVFLNFFLVVPDWDTELLQKQNIFLEILKLSRALKVKFAFPTQTLNVPGLQAQIQEKSARRPNGEPD